MLDRLIEAGIENIMALRGDPPAGQTAFAAHAGRLRLRRRAGALHPPAPRRRGSAWAAPAIPRATSRAATSTARSPTCKAKVDAGADFLITQLFFDNRVYFDFVARARAAGIAVPIVPGIMPIRNVARIERLTDAMRRDHPGALRAELDRRRDDAAAVAALGRRAGHRAVRGAAARRRARHPLLHAEPIPRDARDLDGAQDRPARLALRSLGSLWGRRGGTGSSSAFASKLGIPSAATIKAAD